MPYIEEEGKFPLIEKDPDAVLDYVFDFTKWLGSDNIQSVVGVVVSGNSGATPLVVDSNPNTSKIVTAWLSGGLEGDTPVVRTRILTVAGRKDDRSIRVKIKNK